MWTIVEAKDVVKSVAKAEARVVDEYEFWKSVVRISGPDGLRSLRGMHDEALSGQWKGYRSSRLSGQWRVMYRIENKEVAVYVVRGLSARLPEVTMATKKKPGFVPGRRHSTLTPAKAVRLAREFQEMTQTELAAASGVPQPAIAGIESGRIALRGDRAEKLARALKVHPAVLMWPQWGEEETRGAG